MFLQVITRPLINALQQIILPFALLAMAKEVSSVATANAPMGTLMMEKIILVKPAIIAGSDLIYNFKKIKSSNKTVDIGSCYNV